MQNIFLPFLVVELLKLIHVPKGVDNRIIEYDMPFNPLKVKVSRGK